MLENIAKLSTQYLIDKKAIINETRALYEYGFQLLYSSCFIFLTIIFISLLTDKFYYALTFILFFIPLRLFSGGYHSKTYLGCYICSNIFFVVALGLSYIVKANFIFTLALLLIIIAFSIIFLLAPVQHHNQPLTEKKRLKNKIRARRLLTFDSILICLILWINPFSRIAFMAVITITIVAILLLISKIENGKEDIKTC